MVNRKRILITGGVRANLDWRPGDQPIYISATRKAKHDFGWEPEIKIEIGINRLYDWLITNKWAFMSWAGKFSVKHPQSAVAIRKHIDYSKK